MTAYDETKRALRAEPRRWLLTGVAGFIGSNLLQALLELDQTVVGLDNFATGKRENLDEVQAAVTPERWARFRLLEGDVASPRGLCRRRPRSSSGSCTRRRSARCRARSSSRSTRTPRT